MLRVAVPNKGSLSEAATEILAEAGYKQRRTTKDLVLTDSANEVEFYYLRPRDIAVYVGEGTLDVGISGRDLVLDSHADAEVIVELGFGSSTFRFAGPPGVADSVKDLSGKRVATSYAGVLADHLADNGVQASVVRLDGAVESAVQLGVADVIADVVETGTTLRQAGLEVFGEPILKSEAVLIKRRGASAPPNGLEQLVRRLQGVLVARNYVMMDYDIPAEAVEAANAVAPGLESPTVSPLHREGWVAVRVMVPRAEAQRIMDQLWEIGARAILTTDIHACRI
ncbi:MAG TPA: ATP phosphoribosyltransferase [Kribbella sp.]|jgi:ATP phosphoribosyltransferase